MGVIKPVEHKSKVHSAVISKTFQKDGKWIERKTRSVILVCECGNKYLKTRRNQEECLTCLSRKA